MNFRFIFVLFFLVGCQDYNSNTADRAKYAPVELENNPEFQRAYSVLRNRCANCHTSNIHSAWPSYVTSADWVNSGSGRVIAGNAPGSNLVIRTINSGHTNSNMPVGGSPLPNDEYDAIVEWIDNL